MGRMILGAWLGFLGAAGAPGGQEGLDRALEGSRIRGGLCAVLGAAEVQVPAGLAERGPFLVHWLLPDASGTTAPREALRARRLAGRVSVEPWKGPSLPYADNLVSLLVVLDPALAAEAELRRVLRPEGEMVVRQGDGFRRTVKPRLEGADEWTHWRHGPDRNPVSTDRLVDVVRRVQWVFNSKAVTERSHVLVTGGRAFAQDRDLLVARDAFNGLPLWRARLLKGRDFDWEYSVKVSALIVAKGDRVYALADDGKFKALDAATGKPVLVYEEAGAPNNVVLVDDGAPGTGTLVLADKESLRALDAASGRPLWRHEAAWPHNLIASNASVFAIEGNDRRGAASGEISARELRTGRLLWKKTYDWARRTDQGAYGCERIVYEMRSPHNWREYYEKNPAEKQKDRFNLVVLSAKTGEEIQKIYGTGSSARHGEFRAAFWHKERLITECITREGLSLALFGLDDFSKPAVTFKANYAGDRGFGHCYPPVLTDRFYIYGQLHFTDLDTRKQAANPITRGACNTARPGYLPAYGMIYTFPKHCICFPMLDGNVCLAPGPAAPPEESRELVRGPAWPARPVEVDYSADWPTFRHDPWRSGGTAVSVPVELETLWTAPVEGPDYADPAASEWTENPYLAGRITAPVVGGGLVYVAQSDTHRLVALDEATGRVKWEFTAEGRIDGPPTLHRGMCLFGCRNGWVYNLRPADGALAWKLRVAPADRRISHYGQLESPWPVAGSVLVADGLAYAAAGLHPNADGGIQVACFRPETGEIVWTGKDDSLGLDDPWPDPWDPRKSRPDSNPWRTIRPLEYRPFDLPVRDGDAVAVSRCLFDLKTGRRSLQKTSGFIRVKETGACLPRTAWRYGNERILSPVAVSLGSSVFSTVPALSRLFRVDFERDKSFNTDWVQVSEEDTKADLDHSTAKLYRMGARWVSDSADGRNSVNRAMLAAGENLFTVTPGGVLAVHGTGDGRKRGEMKLDLAAWDGLAAARGRLYVSTVDGKVLCLGGRMPLLRPQR